MTISPYSSTHRLLDLWLRHLARRGDASGSTALSNSLFAAYGASSKIGRLADRIAKDPTRGAITDDLRTAAGVQSLPGTHALEPTDAAAAMMANQHSRPGGGALRGCKRPMPAETFTAAINYIEERLHLLDMVKLSKAGKSTDVRAYAGKWKRLLEMITDHCRRKAGS